MPLNISNFAAQQVDASQAAGEEDQGQGGLYVLPKPFQPLLAGFVPAQNTAYALRFRPARNVNVQNIAFFVTTFSANNPNTDAGFYDSTGAKLATSGNVASLCNTAVGVKLVPLAYQLLAGKTYYVVLNYGTDAAPATVAAISAPVGASSNLVSQAFAATLPAAAATSSCPESFTFANTPPLPAAITYTAASQLPLIALREF